MNKDNLSIEEYNDLKKRGTYNKKGWLIISEGFNMPKLPILEKSEGKKKRGNEEYQICKEIAKHLREYHSDVLYHFDLAGLNLSRAQQGMTKGIQGKRGFPDLFICKSKGGYSGLFIEIKVETPFRKDGVIKASQNNHLEEQQNCLDGLKENGYIACFAWSVDMAILIIDNYLTNGTT
jgi:hypothetical protein